MIQCLFWRIKGSMHKPTDSFWLNHRARSGLCHSLPILTGQGLYLHSLRFRNMVVIQCPHCNLEVVLDDGESGLFDCPHCGIEFLWEGIDEETDHNILTWLDWAASKIYLQVGILVLLFPVALFLPPFLPIYSVCLFVPFISWRYRRSRRMWQSSQDQAKEILEELDLNWILGVWVQPL